MYGYDIFHEKLAEGLIAGVRRNNPPHAYIFEGKKGLGRFETARLFAAALACGAANAPCGACNSCISAKAGTNPDISVVEPDARRKTIGAERIRALIEDAGVKPFMSKRKIYIFPDASLLTEQAQNAFLKLLEEPPDYAVFIIIAENSELLLQTVRSRCVNIRFAAISDERMRAYVDKINPGCKNADFIVKYSQGIPAAAREIIGDAEFDEMRRLCLDKLRLLFGSDMLAAYTLCDFAEKNKDRADLILSLWSSFVRDILFIQSGAKSLMTNSDCTALLSEHAALADEKRALRVLEQLLLTEQMLRRYVSLHAAFLHLGLSVCG